MKTKALKELVSLSMEIGGEKGLRLMSLLNELLEEQTLLLKDVINDY